jgi:hypothetical protein
MVTATARRAPSGRHHDDLLRHHQATLDAARGQAPPVDVHDHTGGEVHITVAQ